MGKSAQDIRMTGLFVATNDEHYYKHQEDDNDHKNCHYNAHVVVMGSLVDGLGWDDCEKKFNLIKNKEKAVLPSSPL